MAELLKQRKAVMARRHMPREFYKYTIKVDGSGQLTKRNRRFLRPVRPYKEEISRQAPAAVRPTAEDTAPPPTQPQPKWSERVAKKSRSATLATAPPVSRWQVLPS